MTHIRRMRQRGSAAHELEAAKRRERILKFGIGTNVIWHGQPAGRVTGFDDKRGRIFTSMNPKDGYDPTDNFETAEEFKSRQGVAGTGKEAFFAHKAQHPEPVPHDRLTPLQKRMQSGDI